MFQNMSRLKKKFGSFILEWPPHVFPQFVSLIFGKVSVHTN